MDRLEWTVPDGDVDLVSGLLWGAGIAGIEQVAGADGGTRLVVSVDHDRVDDAVAAVAGVVSGAPPARSEVADDSWSDAWRPWARATRIGESLVVQPPWIDPIARPGDRVVLLDPMRAWGHGGHPSSVLVCEVLAEAGPLDGCSVLDVGCGSGVLASVAAACGAGRVEAIDLDADAVAATRANAAVNGFAQVVSASTTPIDGVSATFDWVVANIGAEPLVAMSRPLAAAVAPGGHLVLSGLLDDRVDGVVGAFGDLEEVDRPSRDGWSAVVLRRR